MDKEEEACVYCFYICSSCFAFNDGDPDCSKCGKEECVLLWQEKNASLALAKVKSK